MNSSVAGWLCCVAGKRLLQTVSAESCHGAIKRGNRLTLACYGSGSSKKRAEDFGRAQRGHPHCFFYYFFSYSKSDVSVVIIRLMTCSCVRGLARRGIGGTS